jgi:serine/threonine protein phosphatase PrpC
MSLFAKTQEDTHLVVVESSTNQLCKGQDYTYIDDITDTNGEECKVCIVFDGHGDNRVIHFIRSIPNNKMNELLSGKNPIETLANYINTNINYNNIVTSGSTMCLTKIYSNRIECFNCGDSQVAIFKNGSLEYINNEHNYKNEKERVRLNDKVIFKPSSNIKMTDQNTLISVYSEYIEWNSEDSSFMLACSQSLGHAGITGYDPEIMVIPILAEDKYKIIIGSDGLWDMIMLDNEEDMKNLYLKNVNDIMEQTTNRWLQEWNMQDLLNNNPTIVKSKFKSKHCDDIAIIVADINPILK